MLTMAFEGEADAVWYAVVEGACVLTMAFEGEEREWQSRFDGDSVLLRQVGNPVATRIVLADAKGNVLCSAEGDEFTERCRNAPGKGERDYALLLSPDGIRWLSKKEFSKEAEAIHKLREEAEKQRTSPTPELDARRGLWITEEKGTIPANGL